MLHVHKKDYVFWQYWIFFSVNDKQIHMADLIVNFTYYYSDFLSSASINYWGRNVWVFSCKFRFAYFSYPIAIWASWNLKPCPVYINKDDSFLLHSTLIIIRYFSLPGNFLCPAPTLNYISTHSSFFRLVFV